MSKRQRLMAILGGPAFFLVCYYLMPVSALGSQQANGAAGTVVWMALWWILSPVDLAVTAFVPIAVNAVFSLTAMKPLIANFSSETILLLLGASVLTAAWEETGLDRRIAARLLSLAGSNLRMQVAFWFLLSAFMSAVLPNAVVCAALVPISIAMLKYVGEGALSKDGKGALLVLTIVYGAGVGGLATPLGGAMNLVAVDYIEKLIGHEYMYSEWVIRFLPVMALLLVSNAIFMVLQCRKDDSLGGSRKYFLEQYRNMPRMRSGEKAALWLFLAAAGLSFARPLYSALIPGLKPAYVFIICGILSFIFTEKDGRRLLTWKTAQQHIVWALMFVFAGGLAAGHLINATGAASALGEHVAASGFSGGPVAVVMILTMTVILSDITSNTATAAVAIPIVIAVLKGAGVEPMPYLYVAVIGVNLSYMLPTSIRAIPVGYGLRPAYMFKKGLPLTLIALAMLSIACTLLWGLYD